MIVLAILFATWLYFLFARAVFRKVCATTQHRGTRIIAVMLLIILFFIDNIIGNSMYYYLIKTRGGEHIYEQPVKVQGYLIEDKWGGIINYFAQDLFDGRYRYLELKTIKDDKEAPYARKAGYYRFYVSKNDDEKCADYLRRKEKGGWPMTTFPADKCLAYTAINVPESRYMLRTDVRREYFFNVHTRGTTIHDLATGQLMAELTRIYYLGGIFVYWAPPSRKKYPEASVDTDPSVIQEFVRHVFK